MPASRVLPCALALAATLLGCAPASLRVARTDTIHLTTDSTGRDAYRMLRAMETDRRALVETFFPCALRQHEGPIDVVALVEPRSFHRFVPDGFAGVGGVHMSHAQRVVPRPPTLALRWQSSPTAVRSIFRHELTHRLIARCMPQAPAWLHEGLAELLSTAEVTDRELSLGVPPYFFDDLGGRVGRVGAFLTRYVPRERLLSLDALRALPPDGIWVGDDPDQTAAHYASAWALVSVLVTGPQELRRGFVDYRQALSLGVEERMAWQQHLADLPVAEHYARFIEADVRRYTTYPLTAPGASLPATERALTAREADLFWASRVAWDSPAGRRDALAALDALEHREPGSWAHPEVAVLRGGIHAEGGDSVAAAEALRLVHDPDAVAFARLALRMMEEYTSPPLPGQSLERLRARPATELRVEELVTLTQRAITAFEHEVLARAWLSLLQFQRALAEAHLAIAEDATCAQCWVTLGLAEIQSGNVRRGAQSLDRGVALMGLSHSGRGSWVRRAGLYAYGAAGRRMCETVPPVSMPGSSPRDTTEVDSPAGPSSPSALTPDAIRAVIRGHLDAVVACYADERALLPLVQGTVRVRFVIGPDGSVIGAQLADSELAGTLGCCVLREVSTWHFPETGGGLVSVTYPFTLTTQ
jgi:hypothetical protein